MCPIFFLLSFKNQCLTAGKIKSFFMLLPSLRQASLECMASSLAMTMGMMWVLACPSLSDWYQELIYVPVFQWCAPGNVTTAANQIVPLCFAKHSGFGGYDDSLWNHGVRVFRFNLDTINQSVETYIRFLTGEKVRDWMWAKRRASLAEANSYCFVAICNQSKWFLGSSRPFMKK